MKKRGGLLALLSFALAIIASQLVMGAGTATSYYDGWQYSGDTWIVGDEVFYISHLKLDYDKVYLTINNKSTVIENGTCYETLERKYCLVGIFRDVSGATTGSQIKFIGGKAYAGLHLQFFKLGAEVTVTRSFEPSSPERDQDVRATVTFKNPNEYSTDYFEYEDIYPEGVYLVTGSGDWKKSLRAVKYDANLPPFSEKTLYYTIRITDYIMFTNNGSYRYKMNSIEKNLSTPLFTVDLFSKKPYALTTSLSPSSIEVGKQVTLTISIQSKKTGDLEVTSMEIIPVPDVSFSFDPATFTKSGGIYVWSGSIRTNDTKKLTTGLRVSKPGTYVIPLAITIKEADNRNYIQSMNVTFSTSYKQPELILSIREPTVSEGGSYRVAFSVKNPNDQTGFKNIGAVLSSNATFDASGFIDELLPGQTKTMILLENLIAPSVNAPAEYRFIAKGHFDTLFDQELKLEKASNLKVTPINKSIFVTQELRKPSNIPHAGDNITVTIKVQHTNEEIITADVADTYSPGLEFNGGTTTQALYFDAPATKQAYIYSVVIPRSYDKEEFLIRTDVSVRGKPGIISAVTSVPVNMTYIAPKQEEKNETVAPPPATGAENASQQEPSQDSNVQINTYEKEEEGGISGVVNSVMDFIRRLFGFK